MCAVRNAFCFSRGLDIVLTFCSPADRLYGSIEDEAVCRLKNVALLNSSIGITIPCWIQFHKRQKKSCASSPIQHFCSQPRLKRGRSIERRMSLLRFLTLVCSNHVPCVLSIVVNSNSLPLLIDLSRACLMDTSLCSLTGAEQCTTPESSHVQWLQAYYPARKSHIT